MFDFLTINEVAELTRVQARTVRSWIARRRIGFVKAGRGVRIPRAELNKFLVVHNPLPDFRTGTEQK
jgi:excisionase family DNA binding protein